MSSYGLVIYRSDYHLENWREIYYGGKTGEKVNSY